MLSVGRGRFLIPLLVLLLLPYETHGTDGCTLNEWRCNGVCMGIGALNTKCQCCDKTFGYEDLKWCCNNVVLNLSESCEGRCNYYPNDTNRNEIHARSFVALTCDGNETVCVQEGEASMYEKLYKPTICTGKPSCDKELAWCQDQERKGEKCPDGFVRCPGISSKKKAGNSTKSISGQCVDQRKLRDGEVNECLDRSDEDPFQEGKISTSKEAAIVDMTRLKRCADEVDGKKYLGLECGEQDDWPSPCIPMYRWCSDSSFNLRYPVLGTNSTDIYINNPKVCANTSFWRQQPCGKHDSKDMIRCRGSNAGQCVEKSDWGLEDKDILGNDVNCQDKSDIYRPIKETPIKEENPNNKTNSRQTWRTYVNRAVCKNVSNPFKVRPSETLEDYALSSDNYVKDDNYYEYEYDYAYEDYQKFLEENLSSDDYVKDETTNLMMAAPPGKPAGTMGDLYVR